MIRALLLMLFDAGGLMLALSVFGAVISYVIIYRLLI